MKKNLLKIPFKLIFPLILLTGCAGLFDDDVNSPNYDKKVKELKESINRRNGGRYHISTLSKPNDGTSKLEQIDSSKLDKDLIKISYDFNTDYLNIENFNFIEDSISIGCSSEEVTVLPAEIHASHVELCGKLLFGKKLTIFAKSVVFTDAHLFNHPEYSTINNTNSLSSNLTLIKSNTAVINGKNSITQSGDYPRLSSSLDGGFFIIEAKYIYGSGTLSLFSKFSQNKKSAK